MWLLGSVLLGGAAVGARLAAQRAARRGPARSCRCWSSSSALLVEGGFFLWTFWALGDRRVPLRALVPGAIVGAVGLEILKIGATVYLPRLVAGSSALYGPLGVVFAILAWLALFARLIVYASATNTVLLRGPTSARSGSRSGRRSSTRRCRSRPTAAARSRTEKPTPPG